MNDTPPADGCQSSHVVIIGDFTRAEHATLLDELSSLFGVEQLRAHGSIASVLAESRDSGRAAHADLLVVLQTWPEQYTQEHVFDLLDHYPLARLIVCFGPWCDSDGRTRAIWPPAARVPLGQARMRFQQEWRVLQCAAEPLPLTASRAETYRVDFAASPSSESPNLALEVRTPDPAIRDLIAELLRTSHGSVAETPQADPEIIIWDVDPWCAGLAEEIAGAHRQQPNIPIVALAGFPRVHEIAHMRQCGVGAVVAKNAPAEEYLRVIATLSRKVVRRPTYSGLPTAAAHS